MAEQLLKSLNLTQTDGDGCISRSPIDGQILGTAPWTSEAALEGQIKAAHQAYSHWRCVPAPKRGELIRLFGEVLRTHKDALGRLVSLEAGKILQEGLGEVQEMIDMCDFAVGLSRQLYGLTIASERPDHRMMETWHPLGIVGVISAFNFPVAVWAWNFCLSTICGNATIWKPSEKTPLTALAAHALFEQAAAKFGEVPKGLSSLAIGGRDIGEALARNAHVPLISATGSCRMGSELSPIVARRFGRTLLELGGNNAMILTPSANLDLAIRAILFSALGTAGQRCTSLRRLIVHKSIQASVVASLKKAYATVKIGDPLAPGTLMGPLIDQGAYEGMQHALTAAKAEGGQVFGGTRTLIETYKDAYYVTPAIVEMPGQTQTVREETFAPILYVMGYDTLDEAIALQNDVAQGLSSCIFTNSVQEAEIFISSRGSDCGIANVNIGPSGAEIGGAFGGEKSTGGGRESGSDAWRTYMRRATNTVNFSNHLPLAQGITFA